MIDNINREKSPFMVTGGDIIIAENNESFLVSTTVIENTEYFLVTSLSSNITFGLYEELRTSNDIINFFIRCMENNIKEVILGDKIEVRRL